MNQGNSHFRFVRFLTLACLACLLAGCMMAPVVPPMGGAYTSIEAPLDLNCAGGKTIGEKQGESNSVAILGLFAWGDASLHAAAKNGGLTKVDHADYRFKNVLFGIYAKYTTIAYGE